MGGFRTIDLSDEAVAPRKQQEKVRKRVTCVHIMQRDAYVEGEFPVFCAPVACVITKVGIVPSAAITGADTNYMTLQFKNKGADGTGTDIIAKVDFTLGVDVAAFDFKDFGDVSNAVLAALDTVSWEKVETGEGMLSPYQIAIIVWEPV